MTPPAQDARNQLNNYATAAVKWATGFPFDPKRTSQRRELDLAEDNLVERIETAEARVVELERRLQWRSMDSAPKDKTLILGVTEDGTIGVCSRGEDIVDGEPIEFWINECAVFPVAAWQPLPSPPANNTKGQ